MTPDELCGTEVDVEVFVDCLFVVDLIDDEFSDAFACCCALSLRISLIIIVVSILRDCPLPRCDVCCSCCWGNESFVSFFDATLTSFFSCLKIFKNFTDNREKLDLQLFFPVYFHTNMKLFVIHILHHFWLVQIVTKINAIIQIARENQEIFSKFDFM